MFPFLQVWQSEICVFPLDNTSIMHTPFTAKKSPPLLICKGNGCREAIGWWSKVSVQVGVAISLLFATTVNQSLGAVSASNAVSSKSPLVLEQDRIIGEGRACIAGRGCKRWRRNRLWRNECRVVRLLPTANDDICRASVDYIFILRRGLCLYMYVCVADRLFIWWWEVCRSTSPPGSKLRVLIGLAAVDAEL